MSRRAEILEGLQTIPALPTAANRMIVLLRDPDVEIVEVVQTIEYDPGLTSNVLRLANSAYFGGPRTIGSLRDAIMRLGFNRIFQLVITSAILPIAKQEVKGYDLPSGGLLDHSIAVAIGAEELGQQLHLRVPPATFTAGLLHDLGKIVLGTFLEVDAGPIIALALQENLSLEVAESRVLGIDHAEAGAALLERWNIPGPVVETVRWHHQPESFTGDATLMDLVHAADHLSLSDGMGVAGNGIAYRASEQVLAHVDLREEVVESVLEKMQQGVAGLRDILDSPGA